MATHGSLFPFSDNLTTLMFIVASDLQGMNVTAYTFDAVQTIFVDLLCTPKSSMENHANRTFIIENYAEDEYGQRATDEATGAHGYTEEERSYFSTGDDNKYVWQSRKFQDRHVKRGKGKGKGKAKGGSKRIGNAYCGEEQTQDNNWWSEEDSVWWSKCKKGKKGLSKGKNKFPESDSRTFQDQGSDKEFQSDKGTSKDQSGRGIESAYSQSGFSASESPCEEGYGHSWESSDWYSNFTDDSSSSATRGTTEWCGTGHTARMAAIPLNSANHPTRVVLDLGCTRSN